MTDIQPSTGPQVSGLANLPAEVFSALSSEFDITTLGVLRLSCRALSVAATNKLFQLCFQHRTTDLSTKSLNNLVGICSSKFGHLVETITIKACFYSTNELATQLKEKKRWHADGGPGPIFSSSCKPMSEEELAAAQAAYDAFSALKEDQKALKAGAKTVELLTQVLQHLGSRPVSIQLEAAVYRQSLDERLPARGLFGGVEAEMQTIMNDAFQAAIRAISSSSVSINSLHVFDLGHAGHVSLNAFYDSFTPFKPKDSGIKSIDLAPDNPLPPIEIPAGLRSLKSLTVNFSAPSYIIIGNRDSDDEDDCHKAYAPAANHSTHAAYATTLRHFLGACSTTLTNLDIRFKGLLTHQYADSIALFNSLPSLPNLTSLSLRGCLIHPHSLSSIITTSPDLRTITLHRLSLAPTTDPATTSNTLWLPIFHTIARLPHLATLNTCALYLNSFRLLIFPSHPPSALARTPADHYTRMIYSEGCPAVTFTHDDLRPSLPSASEQQQDSPRGKLRPPASEEGHRPSSTGHEIGTPDDVVRYKVNRRRALGSLWLHRWHTEMRREYALF